MSSDSNPKPSKKLSILAGVLVASLIAVGFVTSTTMSGCKPKGLTDIIPGNQVTKDSVTVFFSKTQGSHSIVEDVVRQLPKDAQGNPLEFALKELLKGPTPEEKAQGFYSEIPSGTSLLGLNQNSSTITINLSKQFTGGGGSTSMTQRLEQVKQTAYSVDSSHQVALSVEGKPLDTLGGEGLEVPETLKREQQ